MRLGTFAEVVEHFGGPAKLARRVGRSKQAVCNWRNRGHFPSRLYPAMITLLRKDGAIAPIELWGFPSLGSMLNIDSDAA